MGPTPHVSATVSLSILKVGTKVDVTKTKKTTHMNVSNTEAVDPICGMAVDTAAALHTERDGETFYFSSEHRREKFLATSDDTKALERPGVAAASFLSKAWSVGTKAN